MWTTDALSTIGIGFILRWRVHTQRQGVGGTWRSPGAGWSIDTPPLSAGLPFYRFHAYSWTPAHGVYWLNAIGSDNFSSVAAYRAAMDTVPVPNRGTNVFLYGAEVEVRYVLTKPASSIYDVLDSKSGTITTDFVILRARQQSYQLNTVTVRQTTTFNLPPTGTCTTPSVDPATVNFNTLFASAIPNQGDTTGEKFLNLTFTNCPRINIGYYLHANGKWVDSAQGIVGLPGSSPNANPAIGNPRGFGVQVLHNNSSDGNGPVYISPNVNDPNKQIYWRTPAQGTDSQTGVTHTIALRARVIRTHPADTPITPGPFNTSLIFVVQYP